MSINRNSNLIKAIQPQVNRDPVSYNFDANVWTIGGGGGGESGLSIFPNGEAGGGGGAGAVVSASLSVIPNITWTIEVGSGGSTDSNGENSTAIVYDTTYAGLTTLRAQGGRNGSNSGGGNSGTGSVETTSATASYAAFTGGAQNTGVAGGGAGAGGNGGNGVPFDGNPGTGIGGVGGFGKSVFGSVAGGGGGGITPNNGFGGTGAFGGGNGGVVGVNGGNATTYGSGGGGGGADNGNPSTGGSGYKGTVVVSFVGKIGTQLGEFDITTTNASSSYNSGTNSTTIYFETGSGTFRYTAPFPYIPGN